MIGYDKLICDLYDQENYSINSIKLLINDKHGVYITNEKIRAVLTQKKITLRDKNQICKKYTRKKGRFSDL